MNSKLQCAHIC